MCGPKGMFGSLVCAGLLSLSVWMNITSVQPKTQTFYTARQITPERSDVFH